MSDHRGCCEACRANTRHLRWLTIIVTVFIVSHALLVPLLPRLFALNAAVVTVLLVVAVAILAFLAARRVGQS